MPDTPDDSQGDTLAFYISAPVACPYLPARQEQRLLTFLDDAHAHAAGLLLQAGFRRSQRMFYRPQCSGCTACLSARIVAGDFAPDRTMRRILKRNQDIKVSIRTVATDDELYQLFIGYQQGRHGDSEMREMSADDFRGMMEDHAGNARLLCGTLHGRTVAVMLFDLLPDGTSAVYSFFDTDLPTRSLGTWMILQLAAHTTAQDLPYVYLGYWVAGSPKMAYKSRFQPLQILVKNKWQPFTRSLVS